MPDPSSKLRLELGPARLSATLSIEPGASPAELNEALVAAFLIEHGLPPDPDQAPRICSLLSEYERAPDRRHSAVLSEGFPPKDGVDGRFELEGGLLREAEPATDHSAGAPSGAVNHYASRIGRTVERGAKLGRFIPPEHGFDGFDVYGECIAARPARPASLTFDDSAELSSDGTLIATVGGIVELSHISIRVNPTLEIHGNVDFSTGSIEFPGDVVVHGDVRDCFTVKSGRDLTVHHLVDGATIDAARDCRLDHGMATKQRHTLKVGRDLFARYLSGVDCEVGRDARVDTDITHCHVKVRGEFIGPECTVVRGVLEVNLACEVAELGSESGVETTLKLATEDRASVLLDRAEHMLQGITSRLARAQSRLDDLRSVHGRMTSTQADALTELTFERDQLNSVGSRLRTSMESLRRLPRTGSKVSLTVHRAVHRRSAVFLGGFRLDFNDTLRGPIRIKLDDAGHPEFVSLETGEPQPMPAGVRVQAQEAIPAPTLHARAA